ncbi:MAG: permease-like cell division protein FtsX [Actinomycetes bacterium]
MPKIDYVIRETSSNLARNFTITLASIMTVVVSLFLVGASLMLRQGVQNATKRWQGGIEFVVFLNSNATPEQIAAVGRDLADSPEVERTTFVDQQASYEEFKQLFADSPEMVDSVTADILPPSYRVVPVDKDATVVEQLGEQFRIKPGVKDVAFASATIRAVQSLASRFTVGIFVVAAVLLGAAILLVLNTIRMAMFARRREIEVMKLVGATNWFIRVPFMLEGLIQGIIGAALAVGALALFKPFFEKWLPNPQDFPLVSGFVLSGTELATIFILLGVTGCAVGAIGAAIAVSRFLDV